MLVQIRRGYATACHDLRLSVETDVEGWRAEVRTGAEGHTMYSARRCSLGAAKVAATEFAMFQMAGVQSTMTPEAAARQLRWHEYW